jgi:hypothetical protein
MPIELQPSLPLLVRPGARAVAARGAAVLAICVLTGLVFWWARGQCCLDSQMVYSVASGMLSWAFVELGLRGFARRDQSLPKAGAMVAIVLGALLLGNLAGNVLGDLYMGLPMGTTVSALRGAAGAPTAVAVVSGLAIGLACTFGFLHWVRTVQLDAQARAAELAALRNQLDPHMLFNTLANVRELALTDGKAAAAMVDQLAGFMRSVLVASQAEGHSVADEFGRLTDYVALMQVRMGARLQASLDCGRCEAARVPALLLQPLVENALKHGLEPKPGVGSLQVLARREGGGLVLLVQDDGLGARTAAHGEASVPAQKSFGGLGLKLVRDRLALRYGARASLNIEPMSPGTRVTVRLPWSES